MPVSRPGVSPGVSPLDCFLGSTSTCYDFVFVVSFTQLAVHWGANDLRSGVLAEISACCIS